MKNAIPISTLPQRKKYRWQRLSFVFASVVFWFACPSAPANQTVALNMVTVADTANSVDSSGFGSVGYIYRIGKFVVTDNQYAAFLNAVAATDTYNLYNPRMATDLNVAGISRSGMIGSYTYTAIGSGNKPVPYINWFAAARFANWMHNGQPTGLQTAAATEEGAYTLDGITSGGLAIGKNANAQYWIPNENEWYKAAYYDATLNSGSGGYWLYPTRSNSAPGNIVGPSFNQANIYKSGFSVTQSATYSNMQNYLTDVGIYTGSASYYGTFDQGGNIFEWNDTLISPGRGLRGGSWPGSASFLLSSYRPGVDPSTVREDYGFRIATIALPPINSKETVGPQVTVSGGKVNLTIKSSVAGRGYQLQTSTDLISGWQDVGTVQTGTGSDLVITIPYDPMAPQKFFRLKLD